VFADQQPVSSLGTNHVEQLTAMEQLKLENLQLKTVLAQTIAGSDRCHAQIGQLYDLLGATRAKDASATLTALEATLKTEIEAQHPGFTFDPKAGTLTRKE
jgi:hypothetical protein